MRMLDNAYAYRNAGLLIIRVGLGLMFMTHGGPKLAGGPAYWKMIGQAMSHLHVEVFPVFWGFMAGFAEFGGGLLLILGLFFRPACLMLTFTMVVAAMNHLAGGEGLNAASHAVEAGITFLGLLFIGPGVYSLDERLFSAGTSSRRSRVKVR